MYNAFMEAIKQETKQLKLFMQKFNNDWCMNLAACLAYSTITSLIPIIIALISLAGLLFTLLDLGSKQMLVTNLVSVFPAGIGTKDLVNTLLSQLSKIYASLGIISLVLAIFSGSRLFILIENCFDIIYRVPPRKFLKQNLIAIVMVILFALLVPIMIFTAGLPSYIFTLLDIVGLSNLKNYTILINTASLLGGLAASYLFFQLIYLIVPNERVSFKRTWLGSLIAAISLHAYLTLFPLYVSHFLSGYAGQLAFAIVFLAFFYYFSVILLFGAEINSFWGHHIAPLEQDLVTHLALFDVRIKELQQEKINQNTNHPQSNHFIRGLVVGLISQKTIRAAFRKYFLQQR